MSRMYNVEIRPHQEAKHAEWLVEARQAIFEVGRSGAYLTIDDVREVCPPPGNGKVMGAVFQKKYWKIVGYVCSDRRVSHGRRIAVWQLKDAVNEI